MVRANSATRHNSAKLCSPWFEPTRQLGTTRQSCAVHGVRVAAVQLLSGLQEAQSRGHPRSPWTTMDCAWLRSSMSRLRSIMSRPLPSCAKLPICAVHPLCTQSIILHAVHHFAAELTFLSLADHLARICSPKGFSCSPPAQARYRLLQARYRVDCSENHGLRNSDSLPSCRVQF